MNINIYAALLITLTGTWACTNSRQAKGTPTPNIIVKQKTLIPEGIAVHPYSGAIYISSIAQQKLVRVHRNGEVEDVLPSKTAGFMQGLGMKFTPDGKQLWVCSSDNEGHTALYLVDVARKKVIEKFSHDSAKFFNDLVISRDGFIYITDTYGATVFRYNPASSKIQQWLKHEHLSLANGIALSADENVLFVASGNRGVQRIDVRTREVRPVSDGKQVDYGIDGLVCVGRQLIGVIGWPQNQPGQHRVIRYHLSEDNFFMKADTLAIGLPYLNCPTTAALKENKLFVLSNTGLQLYNRHQQKMDKIMDSLSSPVILQLQLK